MLTKTERKANRRAMERLFIRRRERLRELCNKLVPVAQEETRSGAGWAEVARIYGVSHSFLVQLAGPNPVRVIGERAARNLEVALGVATGYLDQD